MVTKIKVPVPTKEQIEYEDAKKSFRLATAKARLNSAGIDTSKISQQAIDNVMRIFDDMDYVQQDTQQKISKLQHDTEIAIQKVNQHANQQFSDIQKKYQDLVDSLMKDKKEDISQIDSAQVQQVTQVESPKEEVREKTHEEKVSEITNILLNYLREPVSEKINEIMCTIDKKANETVIESSDKEKINPEESEKIELEHEVIKHNEL